MIEPSWLNTIFVPSDEDRQITRNQIRLSNARRALYITTGAVLCNLFFLLHFYYNVNAGTPIEIKWKRSIILMHTVLISVHTVLFLIAFYVNRTKRFYGRLSLLMVTVIFILLPLWGAVAVVLDQWVTSSIIAFFLTCAVCALGLLMRPSFAMAFYAIAYIVFYVGISFTQQDANLLLTNRVNGFAGTAICCGVSMLLWNSNLIRYRQNNLIAHQKKDIQSNYEKLLASSEELAKANAAKDKFFSIIAHDLRGPVTSTMALAQLISSESAGYKPEEHSQMMQLLQNSLSNTSKLLENLLVWSQSQTNSIVFAPVTLNLYAVVESNAELLSVVASEKNIGVQYDIDRNIEVYADREMMNTVVRNLLSNAFKFTNDNGLVTITGKITDAETWQGQCVEVSISDNGLGMTEAVLNSLFVIDKKTTSIGTRNEKGTGLGLLLCKEFVEKHKGIIWAESVPGEGSRFTFQLPVIW